MGDIIGISWDRNVVYDIVFGQRWCSIRWVLTTYNDLTAMSLKLIVEITSPKWMKCSARWIITFDPGPIQDYFARQSTWKLFLEQISATALKEYVCSSCGNCHERHITFCCVFLFWCRKAMSYGARRAWGTKKAGCKLQAALMFSLGCFFTFWTGLDWWRHLKWFLATLGGEDPRLFQNPGGGGLTNNRFQRDDVCGRRGSGKT
jgi:hypothetical protein